MLLANRKVSHTWTFVSFVSLFNTAVLVMVELE